MATCIENDPDLFRQLRSKVLWSCDAFPDDFLPATTPLPIEPQEESPATGLDPSFTAEEEAGVGGAPLDIPEPTMQAPLRVGGIPARTRKVQPDRARERLVKAPAKLGTGGRAGAPGGVRRAAPIRRARDDTSGLPYLMKQRGFSVNQTHEVCGSVVKTDVEIVRAESQHGEWEPLVQVGNCRQIVRTDECLK